MVFNRDLADLSITELQKLVDLANMRVTMHIENGRPMEAEVARAYADHYARQITRWLLAREELCS